MFSGWMIVCGILMKVRNDCSYFVITREESLKMLLIYRGYVERMVGKRSRNVKYIVLMD